MRTIQIHRPDLTLEELHVLVGSPLAPGAAVRRRNGDYLEVAWEEPNGGSGGWSWALFIGRTFVAQGWTSGNRRDRDAEIRRARDEHGARLAS